MGILKAVLSLGLFIGGISVAEAATLKCASHSNAPTYEVGRGQWRLEAELRSDFTLRNVKLKNMANKDLGSETKASSYDKRITDVRMFELKPDVFCNYELSFPRGFSGLASFQVGMTMTCNDMFDGNTVLNCRLQ